MKRAIGDRLSVATSLGDLGLAEIELGRLAEGEEALKEALGIFVKNGQKDGIAEAVQALGRVAQRRGRAGAVGQAVCRLRSLTVRAGDQGPSGRPRAPPAIPGRTACPAAGGLPPGMGERCAPVNGRARSRGATSACSTVVARDVIAPSVSARAEGTEGGRWAERFRAATTLRHRLGASRSPPRAVRDQGNPHCAAISYLLSGDGRRAAERAGRLATAVGHTGVVCPTIPPPAVVRKLVPSLRSNCPDSADGVIIYTDMLLWGGRTASPMMLVKG